MSVSLAPLAVQKFFDNNGNPAVGAKLFTYIAATTTKVATYTDSTGGPTNANPIILNARGECDLWLTVGQAYKLTLAPATDTDPPTNAFWSRDQITALMTQAQFNTFLSAASGSSLVNSTVIRYDQTAAEIAAGVTPTNYFYQPGFAVRQATNTTPGTTNMRTGIQNSVISASALNAETYLSDTNALGSPILITSASTQNLSIIGNGRVSTLLTPLSASLSTAPQNVNALIINQKDNGHLHLRKFRVFDSVVYTGIFLHAVEGGCADASGQAAFSMVVDDCWFSFSTNNSGIFRGGFSNLQTHQCVYESTKTGCWIYEGVGNGDQLHADITMNGCYDSYLYGAIDTQIKAAISVKGLHAYQHFRGPVFEIKNGVEMIFNDIIVEPNSANVGGVGLGKFTDCTQVIYSDGLMVSRSGIPQGAIGIEIVNGCTGKFSNIKTDATTGVQFSGVGALDVTFDNCDFIGCAGSAVNWLSGTLSGKVLFRQCRFNNSQLYGLLVTAGTHSWDLTLEDCEIMNAGLNGTATNRNLDISTSGAVRLIRCKIGQDNGSAAAAYYIRNLGAGTFEVIDPVPIGVAPTGFNTGNAITLNGVNSDMPTIGTQYAYLPAVGGSATYTLQFGRWNINGRRFYFEGQVTINAIGTGSANTISGFPFASSATTNSNGGGYIYELNTSGTAVTAAPTLLIGSNATSFVIKGFTAGAASDGTINAMANGTNIRFQGSYPLP